MQSASLRERFSNWVFDHIKLVSGLMLVATLFFAAGLPGVRIETIFKDLLPQSHPYTQVFLDHPNFGSPLTITVMVEDPDGSIYDVETLQTVWNLTSKIDLAPAVDHTQVISITTPGTRFLKATPTGIFMRPVMGDHPPSTKEEALKVKDRILRSPGARTFLVSPDGSATLVQATFIPRLLDYGETFAYVRNMLQEARAKHPGLNIYAAGVPMMTGWVYHYQTQMLWIFAVTLGALFLALALYMRNVAGTLTPLINGGVSAIWGFGLVGWLSLPVEPLLMLVPLLLVARAFSHTVQYTERYYEVLHAVRDKDKAGRLAFMVMMGPGTLGVFTDAFALTLIMLSDVPAMVRFAFFTAWWSFALVPTAVLLSPLVLHYMPEPRNIDSIVGDVKNKGPFHRGVQWVLDTVANWSSKVVPARISGVIMAVFTAFVVFYGLQIDVGDPVEGTPLLWPDSIYNISVRQINNKFPGVNTLEVILDSHQDETLKRTASSAEATHVMITLQDYMERHGPYKPTATLSFADYLRFSQRLYNGGDPRWAPLGKDDAATRAAAAAAMVGSGPKAYLNVIDIKQQDTTVSFWYKSAEEAVVNAALNHVHAAVEKVGVHHGEFKVRCCSGSIALQKAKNEIVEHHYWQTIILLNLVMIILTGIGFKSFVAAIMLLIPVNISNFAIIAAMHLSGFGLTINSSLIAAVGVGVGIDYGIYLLSRIVEERDTFEGDFSKMIHAAITTTGRAIIFTATIMLIGILPWYFLSGLKFLAMMGLLLVGIMVINMVMSLVVLPLLVWFFRPRFTARNDLWVTEELDLRQYAPDNTSA